MRGSTTLTRRVIGWGLAGLVSSVSLWAGGADGRLIEAVQQQDRAAVRALLTAGVDVAAVAGDGSTALHWAAHHNDGETVELLLKAGAPVDAVTDYGATPLTLAVMNGNSAVVARLLQAGASATVALPSGETALMTAARAGSAAVVEQLLARGAAVNATDTARGQSALMWAVSARYPAVVKVLLAHGADVRAESKNGFTPLMFAARMGDLETAQLLVAAGADVNQQATGGAPLRGTDGYIPTAYRPLDRGFTALVVATVRGHVALATWLLEQGADPNAAGAGYTALHWAAGTWEGRNTGVGGFEGNQLYMPRADDEWYFAAGLRSGKLELVQALLARGADPNVRLVKPPPLASTSRASLEGRNIIGATPFFLAARAGDVAIMRLLVAAGADPHLGTVHNPDFGKGGLGPQGTFGALFPAGNVTPLMAAAGLLALAGESVVTESAALEAVKLALELGNDLNAVSDAGDTPLHGAAHMRWSRIVQLLVDKGAQINALNALNQPPLYIAERTLQFGGIDTLARTDAGDLLRQLGADQRLAAAVTPGQQNTAGAKK